MSAHLIPRPKSTIQSTESPPFVSRTLLHLHLRSPSFLFPFLFLPFRFPTSSFPFLSLHRHISHRSLLSVLVTYCHRVSASESLSTYPTYRTAVENRCTPVPDFHLFFSRYHSQGQLADRLSCSCSLHRRIGYVTTKNERRLPLICPLCISIHKWGISHPYVDVASVHVRIHYRGC